MKHWLCAIAGAIALLGCAGSGEKKGGTDAIVHVQEDKAQGLKTVEFAPQLMDCGRVAHCPTLGAQWSSTTPNRATLLIGTWGGQLDIESIEFNARPNGPLRVRALAKDPSTLPGVTAFVVPMDTLERVALSRGTWVRVQTKDGQVLEENMYTGDRSSMATDALKRFLVEAYKDTDKSISLGISDMFGKPYEPNYNK